MADALQDHLKIVRVRFIKMLDERLDELEEMRVKIEQPENRTAAFEQVQFITHKIAGTAGMLGFEDLGTQARTTENTIIAHLAGGSTDTSYGGTVAVIDAFIEAASTVSSENYWKDA